MRLRLVAAVPCLAAVLVASAGCSSSGYIGDPDYKAPASSKPAEPKPADPGYYAEETKDGRFYVFGREATHQAFVSSGRAPQMSKTDIGGGPDGATVIYEFWDKLPEMTARLEARFVVRRAR